MKHILITDANSFVGTNIEKWLMKELEKFAVDAVDTMNDAWKQVIGKASNYQVQGAKNGMLNVGSFATTNYVFIVGME